MAAVAQNDAANPAGLRIFLRTNAGPRERLCAARFLAKTRESFKGRRDPIDFLIESGEAAATHSYSLWTNAAVAIALL
jgi:hypothetical protein